MEERGPSAFTMNATGRVVGAVGGVYRVQLEDGQVVAASLRGRLKRETKRPGTRLVVGDRVRVDIEAETATVEEVLPRRSELKRRGPVGRQPKVVAANVDQILVVASIREPRIGLDVVDRFLVVGESTGLEVALIVNKSELVGPAELEALRERYRGTGYPLLLVSAKEGHGLPALEELLRDRTSVLIGPSGVGKTSLLNALDPGLDLRVGELSRKVQRGRHTTVRSRIISLSFGADVVDTPGFSDAGLWGVAPEDLDQYFPELRGRTGECRFRGCLHRAEPDCAVKAAVNEEALPRDRYSSYLRLLEETEAGTEW